MPATISGGHLWAATFHDEGALFFPGWSGNSDECRWYGHCKAPLFSLGSERVILPGAEVWGLAFALVPSLFLGFLVETHPAM